MSDTTERLLQETCAAAPQSRRNLAGVLGACLLWATTFLGATYAIRHELATAPLAWLLALLPAAAGLGVLLAYVRFLREADARQRLVQLRAMALAFGAGWVALSGYPLLERLGAPAIDVGDYVVVMAVAYALGSVFGQRGARRVES